MNYSLGGFPLREQLSLQPAESAPDLLGVIGHGDPDHGWVHETLATLEQLQARGRRLWVSQCECAPTPVGIVVGDESLWSDVTGSGDVIFGGVVVMRESEGAIDVWPRLCRGRTGCGAVVFGHHGQRVLQAGAADIGDRIASCLSGAVASRVFSRLSQAARTPVPDPRAVLQRANLPSAVIAATLRLAAHEEPTVHGLVFALAALARAENDLRARVRLERRAEDILAAARLLGLPAERGRFAGV